MLRDHQDRQLVEKWSDKLAPKVAEIRAALRHREPEEIAWRSGASLDDGRLHLKLLYRPYAVDATSFRVTKADGQPAGSFVASLILTYLETADGAPLADHWISFRELPNGGFYHRAFQGYAPNRLSKRWALNLEGFVRSCQRLGGVRLELGDAAFSFRVLPRIEVAAVYWLGDEEFASRASLLFDANAHHYMVTDGLAILGSQLVGRILATGQS